MTALNVTVPHEIKALLEARARAEDRSLSSLVRRLIASALGE
jgi:predicted HicB family RNase H-like nuclease